MRSRPTLHSIAAAAAPAIAAPTGTGAGGRGAGSDPSEIDAAAISFEQAAGDRALTDMQALPVHRRPRWRSLLARVAGLPLVLSLVHCQAPDAAEDVAFPAGEQARFDAALQEMHASQQAVGSLLTVGDSHHRYAGALGLADLSSGREMTPDTLYRTASIAKTFTGALVLALHEEGKLSVDDPLSDHVTTVPNAENITLRMLLTHTSGLANYTKVPAYREAAADPDRVITYEDLVGFAVEQGPEFDPGAGWSYCNTGYILLGMIAESITGRSLFEELRERYFLPLGMTHTHPYDPRTPPPELATGYEITPDGPVKAYSPLALHTYPADGGYVTTLDDMRIWAHAFLGGHLHSAETLALARQPEGGALLNAIAKSFDLESGGYGLGFIVANDRQMGPLYAGAGNGDGVRTFVGYLPESDLGFALFVDVGDSEVPIVQTLSATGPVLARLREHVAAQ